MLGHQQSRRAAYGWCSKRQKIQSSSEWEQSLAEENARFKRQLADQAVKTAFAAGKSELP